jgi:hypothetical protein
MEVPGGTPLILDRSYTSILWNFYQPDRTGVQLFGIAPAKDGPFQLVRPAPGGATGSTYEAATCADLPAQGPLSLYDPAGRRLGEGAQWPSCLHGRSGWVFSPQSGHWEQVPQLLP